MPILYMVIGAVIMLVGIIIGAAITTVNKKSE